MAETPPDDEEEVDPRIQELADEIGPIERIGEYDSAGEPLNDDSPGLTEAEKADLQRQLEEAARQSREENGEGRGR